MSDLKERVISVLKEVREECKKHEYCESCVLADRNGVCKVIDIIDWCNCLDTAPSDWEFEDNEDEQ